MHIDRHKHANLYIFTFADTELFHNLSYFFSSLYRYFTNLFFNNFAFLKKFSTSYSCARYDSDTFMIYFINIFSVIILFSGLNKYLAMLVLLIFQPAVQYTQNPTLQNTVMAIQTEIVTITEMEIIPEMSLGME